MEFPPEWEIRPLDDFPSATCKSFSRPLGMECFLEMSGLIPGGFRFELGGTSELAVNIPALSVLGAEAQGKITLLPTPLTPPLLSPLFSIFPANLLHNPVCRIQAEDGHFPARHPPQS